ncbi:MAG: dihydropteroate synthase [Candidatus Hodarchaeales archaeon]|jgi:dihydropteroate synthase
MRIVGEIGGVSCGDGYRTLIMGVMNLSPASFYKRSVLKTSNAIQDRILEFISEGADIIDVGAISSAPSFIYNSVEKESESMEIDRLKVFFDTIKEISEHIPISVDTKSHKTAKFSLKSGASMINDISGLKSDSMMAEIVAEYDASITVMACQSQPGDVFKISDIVNELEKSIEIALNAGISRKKIIIDPGLGSWVPERKTKADYLILARLENLRVLKQPILVGISRKSFIGAVIKKPPEKRLWGSLAATSIAISNGAHIIRTHDVGKTKDACLIIDYLKSLIEKETSYK